MARAVNSIEVELDLRGLNSLSEWLEKFRPLIEQGSGPICCEYRTEEAARRAGLLVGAWCDERGINVKITLSTVLVGEPCAYFTIWPCA